MFLRNKIAVCHNISLKGWRDHRRGCNPRYIGYSGKSPNGATQHSIAPVGLNYIQTPAFRGLTPPVYVLFPFQGYAFNVRDVFLFYMLFCKDFREPCFQFFFAKPCGDNLPVGVDKDCLGDGTDAIGVGADRLPSFQVGEV